MLSRLTKRLLTPSTRFEPGNVRNEKQAQAAKRVAELQSEVQDLGISFAKLDETESDANKENPGSVFAASSGYKGLAEFGQDSELRSLELDNPGMDGGSFTFTTDGDRTEIHKVNKIDGPADSIWSPSVLVQEEWVILDGNKASYKAIDYWSHS